MKEPKNLPSSLTNGNDSFISDPLDAVTSLTDTEINDYLDNSESKLDLIEQAFGQNPRNLFRKKSVVRIIDRCILVASVATLLNGHTERTDKIKERAYHLLNL